MLKFLMRLRYLIGSEESKKINFEASGLQQAPRMMIMPIPPGLSSSYLLFGNKSGNNIHV